MERMIDNYINGNLTTAKKQAKRFKFDDICDYLTGDLGYSLNKAYAVTRYIKNPSQEAFQAACDAE
jgi:hypothetical protein